MRSERTLPSAAALARRTFMVGMTGLMLWGCAGEGLQSLNRADQADVVRIEAYLNGLSGAKARFIQTWPDGGASSGVLSFEPGSMRLDYSAPHPMLMVASGGHLALRDDATHSLTRMGLAHNPLGLLLQTPLHLSGAITVTSVQHGAGSVQISLARTANPSQGLLTLQFSDPGGGLTLLGIEGVDERGHHTKLHLYDLQTGNHFGPDVFVLPHS